MNNTVLQIILVRGFVCEATIYAAIFEKYDNFETEHTMI